MSILWFLPLAGLLWAIYYWLVVITEGVYLGGRMVVWLYDWYAPRYDAIKQYVTEEEQVLVVEPLLGELGRPSSPPLILDVATGTGRVPYFMLQDGRLTRQLHGRIIGLEPAGKMLAHAVANCQPFLEGGGVDWVQQTAVPLPFADNTFSAITCLEALEFLPDETAAVAEMVRVLQHGAPLFLTRRIGWEARLFIGRYRSRPAFEAWLETLGLEDIIIVDWQSNYDLVIARKSLASSG
jgi:SAM-dependent methyltransferase